LVEIGSVVSEEKIFFNKLGVLIDGNFKFGVLLLVFVRFLGGDTGNLYRNVFCKESINVSFMSLDESIGKIEVDPKEEASVVEVFQDVLDKLSDVGKKDKVSVIFSKKVAPNRCGNPFERI
jgi:hypothetical protein